MLNKLLKAKNRLPAKFKRHFINYIFVPEDKGIRSPTGKYWLFEANNKIIFGKVNGNILVRFFIL